ncbi:tol-pal system protein YbgF [candidate division KSB1 bacterium]|nr:tol-pal system protein YbgF [candidate division KSB1 bacterium]
MKSTLKAFLLLALLLLLSACATRKEITNFKNDTFYIRAQVDSLRAEQRRLRAALVKLATLTEQNAEANSRLRADLKLQIDQLTGQNQLLSDRLEETGRRISNLPSKMMLAKPVTPPADTAKKPNAVDTAAVRLRQLEEAQRLYDSAYQDFVKGQYALALQGFTQYLQMQPTSALADNAQYWIGECHYSQKKYAEAIQAFQAVISKYPEGEKIASAMLKLAYAQITAGQTTSGKTNLEALIKRFPESNEAKLARTRLQELRR